MNNITIKEAIERIQSIKSKVSLYNDVMALRMAEEALENRKSIIEELEKIKEEFEAKLKSEEVQNDYWYHVINNKSYLFRSILTEHIEKSKGDGQ